MQNWTDKSKIHIEPKNEVETGTHSGKQAPKLAFALRFLLNPMDLRLLLWKLHGSQRRELSYDLLKMNKLIQNCT